MENVGTGPTTGTVTVTDTVPATFTVTLASGTGWNCAATSGNNVSCTYTDNGGVLAVGATSTITINVTPVTAGSGTNNASVTTPNDPTPGNDDDDDPFTTVQPDLVIDKSHTGDFNVGV